MSETTLTAMTMHRSRRLVLIARFSACEKVWFPRHRLIVSRLERVWRVRLMWQPSVTVPAFDVSRRSRPNRGRCCLRHEAELVERRRFLTAGATWGGVSARADPDLLWSDLPFGLGELL